MWWDKLSLSRESKRRKKTRFHSTIFHFSFWCEGIFPLFVFRHILNQFLNCGNFSNLWNTDGKEIPGKFSHENSLTTLPNFRFPMFFPEDFRSKIIEYFQAEKKIFERKAMEMSLQLRHNDSNETFVFHRLSHQIHPRISSFTRKELLWEINLRNFMILQFFLLLHPDES